MAHRFRGGSTGSDESSSDEDDRRGRMLRSTISSIKRPSPKKTVDATPPRSRSGSVESGERSESESEQRKHDARTPSASPPPTKRKRSRSKSPDEEKHKDDRDKSKSPDQDRRKRDRSRDRYRDRGDYNHHRKRSHYDRDSRNRYDNRREEDRYNDRRDRYYDRQDHHRDRRDDRESRKRRHDDDEDSRRDRRKRRSPREEEDDKENKRDEEKKGRDKDSGENTVATGNSTDTPQNPPPAKKSKDDLLNTRTGGAYIPPARLRMMQAQITDKSSEQYQRISWEALKKSLNGLINKVNVSNITEIIRELFQENIVRGRGLLTRSMIQAQAASPTFTHVYAALVAIINTKFPNIGELILKRLIIQFKRGFRRNDKNICLTATRFIAHLVNQQVAHEVVALEILTLLLENPTDDSVEVAINFLKECGQKLTEVSPRGIHAIFERLRNVLHEGSIDKRTQYMIEVMFAVRKDGFKDHPAVPEELDLVEEDDQFTHLTMLDEAVNGEEMLNVFKNDPEYLENEEKYKTIKRGILDESSSDEEGSGSGSSSSDDSDDEEDEEDAEKQQQIIDQTETNMIAFRRTVYLTLQSSLDFEECAHKLLKMEIKPGYEKELCNMILDCCAQLRTYEKFYGLLAQRFCMLDRKYIEPYQDIFEEQYTAIHRLETNKLRNVAKFFAHLLFTDAIPWTVLQIIKLNEDDTTSSSRIFIKILFQELCEYMGLAKLNDRLKDPTLQEFFEGLFPRDNPRNARFAINFFTSIGLGGLTDELREHLKNMPKVTMLQQPQQAEGAEGDQSSSSSSSDSSSSDSSSGESSSDDSSSDSSDDEDSSSSSSSSDSSDSESETEARKRNKKKTTKKVVEDKLTERRKKHREEEEEPKHRRNRKEEEDDRPNKRDRGRNQEEDGNRKTERRKRRAEGEQNGNELLRQRREENGERSSDRRRREENGDDDRPRRMREEREEESEEPNRSKRRAEKRENSVERDPRNERRRADRHDGENEVRKERSSGRNKERGQNKTRDRDSVESDDREKTRDKMRTKERERSERERDGDTRRERHERNRQRRSESEEDNRSRRRR
ncbi:pre-mRNA-splicing factor CWC22 homolog [Lingula anatina]|uniref:Pre-mRNA-splicing factor CWC22 homolog n=1 Tax=Lingula anatina TaxID=7574 RepID=A0A1S3HG61_LINAN|nr:pre-mRNA-splicing factor CWC22 homolog [Lingula anatina]|eukprot:XP_013385068.1 pre-mRNA-splicing factor CWC22 homolog [Lingula anatina]